MDIGICTGFDHAEALAAAGVDYLEVNCQGTFVAREDDAVWQQHKAAAQASPLPAPAANCFLPGDLRSTGDEVDRDAILAYADTAFARAAEIDCGIVVFGSGGSRKLVDGLTPEAATGPFTELLAAIGPVAGRHGVTVVLEPLNTGECNFVTSVGEGAAIVRAADHPNIRLLADLYHMLRDDQGPEELRGHVELLAHVHVAERDARTPPGTAGDDFRAYLAELLEGGYAGRISMESKWDDLPTQAGSAVAALRAQIDEVSTAGSR